LKLRVSDDLLRLLAGITAVVAGLSTLLLGSSPVTFVLGLLLLFFLPGYALTRLVFHERVKSDMFVLLSIALSVLSAMLISVGLALAGILTQEVSIISLVGLTVVALMADKILHHENRKFDLELSMPRKEDLDPIILAGIVFGIVLILIFTYVLVTTHPPSTTYIALMSENMDLKLPKNASVGERVNFTLMLKNGEGHNASFRVEIYFNLTKESQLTCHLRDGENRTFLLNATMLEPGFQKISVKVYIDGVYYRELHFWVNVVEP